jgi:hypothetical protein
MCVLVSFSRFLVLSLSRRLLARASDLPSDLDVCLSQFFPLSLDENETSSASPFDLSISDLTGFSLRVVFVRRVQMPGLRS